MTKIIITKAILENMIETADNEKLVKIIGRACIVLFKRQTESEKEMNAAITTNNRGFCKQDAREGGITAKSYMKNGTLADWQIRKWTKKDCRGTMRIAKYWSQLNEEAVTNYSVNYLVRAQTGD